MKVNGIKFENESPSEVSVTMTIAEAVLIADYVGSATPTNEEIGSIWDALTGFVFNAYWEGGLDDAKREVRS